MKLHFDQENLGALNRLKEIWSHAMPHASYADLIKRAANQAVEKNDPLKKIARAEARAEKAAQAGKASDVASESRRTRAFGEAARVDKSETPAPRLRGRQKSEPRVDSRTQEPAPDTKAKIRRAVWKRDQSRCTFVEPRTQERCGAKHFIEEDHIIPKAMGGAYSVEDIRLRCRVHNQRHAVDSYGLAKMREHIQHG
jgi:5-methylcytosine-specific restriction endonuclease McrA